MRSDTIWDTISDNTTDKLMNDPSLRKAVVAAYPIVADSLSDVAFQVFGSRPNDADKYATVGLADYMRRGIVASIRVMVGSPPAPDKDEEANNHRLSQLPHPFRAHFDTSTKAGMMISDGIFWWDEPVAFDMGGQEVVIPPMSVPLEAGYMPSGKMLYAALGGFGPGIARWPYRSDTIHVIAHQNWVNGAIRRATPPNESSDLTPDDLRDKARSKGES